MTSLPHVPTENSGECSTCWQPWPCDVARAWEHAHRAFCPRASRGVDVCSTHLRPGDRYLHALTVPMPSDDAPCGLSCPGECGWNPDDPDDPCSTPPTPDQPAQGASDDTTER